ncbi:MAG: LecA/PA-IL family lectin [Pyrinomonadaceae bacterium]
MPFSSNIFRIFTSVLLIFLISLPAFADTLRLKDGSIIKGKIVGFGSGKFTVAIGEGSRRKQLTFLASEVESIQFDSPSDQPQIKNPANRTVSYKEPIQAQAPPKIISTNDTSQPKPSGDKIKPIEWTVKVLADNTSNGWTNSGWVVKKGQRIRIVADGKIQLGKNQSSSPSGLASLDDGQKLLKSVATGALIAVIGDDNNDFIYVGAEREFTATRDGALFLGVNEGFLDDNSGFYNVKIEIIPDDGK